MSITQVISKISQRAKYAAFAVVFLTAYAISMLAPFVPVANAAGQITFGSKFENQTDPNNPNAWGTGQLSGYSEGDTILFRFDLTANNATSAGQMHIIYDKGACQFFNNYFEVVSVQPSIATVTKGGTVEDAGSYTTALNVQFNQVGTTTVYFKLQLSNTAGNCSGSNTGVRQGVPKDNQLSGDFSNGGAKNLPISAGSVLINPGLTLTKVVSSGEALPEDFYFTVAPAINGQSTFNIPAGQNSITINEINPDGQFVITEHGPDGYVMTAGAGSSCVVTSLAGGQMTATVTAGRPSPVNASCTFTNSRATGLLKVVKDVVNDNGGNKTYADFHFSVDGGTSQTFNATTGPDGEKTLTLPTGTYTVTEPEANTMGYATTYNNCAQIAVTAGATATCTITNDDRPATLIVNKVIQNQYGGNKTYSNFSYTVNNGAAVTFEADGSNSHTVNAGTYNIVEMPAVGYTTTYDNCANIVLSNGETKTCTITNTELPSTLTIIKRVLNNNGGTLGVTDFGLSLKETTSGTVLPLTFTPINATDLTGLTTYTATVTAKSNMGYTLSETGVATYAASGWSCVGLTATGSVTDPLKTSTTSMLAEGGTATCTITNDDIAPSLTLIKNVTNDNGGTLDALAWTLTATGPTMLSGTSGVTSGTTFSAGSYTLSESSTNAGAQNYVWGTAWNCGSFSVVNNVITIALGQTVTCTITNDDIAPKLTLVKNVVNDNGGKNVAADWTLTATGPTTITGAGTVTSDEDFEAGVYTLTESGPAGYTASNWSCDGGVLSGNSLTIGIGADVTCTITNNDQAGTLVVKKVVDNLDTNLTQTPADFTFVVDGNVTSVVPIPFTEIDETHGSNSFTVDAGTYNVTETADENYTTSYDNCKNIVVANGETETCTVTNTAIRNPLINIVKSGPAQAHEGETVTYTFTVTNPGNVPFPSGYVEDVVDGTDAVDAVQVTDDDVLDPGETWIFTRDYVIPAGQVADVHNTATVCANGELGTEDEYDACDSDEHTLDVLHPGISVVKTGPANAQPGTNLSFTFTVTNTGDTPLKIGSVLDDVVGSGTYVSGDTNLNGWLDISETWIYKANSVAPMNTGNVKNTVTVCADDMLSKEVCAQSDHTTIIYKPQVLADTGNSIVTSTVIAFSMIAAACAVVFSRRKPSNDWL